MDSPTILITDCDLPGTPAEDFLTANGFTAIRAESTNPTDMTSLGHDAVGLIVQWAPITAEVLDALPHLRVISRLGIGFDMIDVDAATSRGIVVANTPTYCTEEVAMHTVAMVMDLVRGITLYDRAVGNQIWKPVVLERPARRPSTLTVGVVGFGRIGAIVARSCAALGFSVMVSDPYANLDAIRDCGYRVGGFEEVLATADVLTLHAPLTTETHHMLNRDTLALMKPGSMVVNTCRGGLIDEDALVNALRSGSIGSAALDVFESEPLNGTSELHAVPNAILTPHSAWFSPEALVDLPIHAARNITEYFSGQAVPSIVNPAALGHGSRS